MAIVRSAFLHSFANSLIRFAVPTTLLVAAAALPACSSDNSSSSSDGGVDAGTGGTTGTGGANTGGATNTGGTTSTGGATNTGGTTTSTGGGAATGGTAGSGGAINTGGATNTGGMANTGGKDGGTPDASNDAGPVPPACPVRADGGAASRVALAGLTDFATAAEFVAVDLGNGSVLSDTVYPDQDSIPVSHGGLGFILEQTRGRVNTLCGDGSIHFPIELDHADGGIGSNPHDVVPVPGTTKAYVSLYGANRIAILDLSTGAVTGSVDVGRFLDPSDHDGLVETDVGVYDPTTKLVYFALQRLSSFACPEVPSLLIGIDPATDSVVDLPGGPATGRADGGKSDAGKGSGAIALHFVSPSSLALDGGRLFVLASGCQFKEEDGGEKQVRHGIEVVTLATGTTTPVYTPTTQNFLTGVSLIGDGALVSRYSVDFSSILWNRWDLSSPDLGAALSGVPDAAVVETANTLVGTEMISSTDGGSAEAVVRYDVTSGNSTLVAKNPWYLGFTNAAGVVIVP